MSNEEKKHMSLVEALAQDLPIRPVGYNLWLRPVIVSESGPNSRVGLERLYPTMDPNHFYPLTAQDFQDHNWEAKTPPLSFEFTCYWHDDGSVVYPIIVSASEAGVLRTMSNTRKKFRVVCEEVVN